MVNRKYVLEKMPLVSEETVESLMDIIKKEYSNGIDFVRSMKKKVGNKDPIIATLIGDLESAITYESLSRQSTSMKLEKQLSESYQRSLSQEETEIDDLRKSILEGIQNGQYGRYTKDGLPKISMENFLDFMWDIMKNKGNIAKYFRDLEEVFAQENPILYNIVLKNGRKNLSLCVHELVRRQFSYLPSPIESFK